MLADKVVIVTGAAGNLGAELVSLLSRQGARVVAVGRTEASLDGVLRRLEPAGARSVPSAST